MDMDDHNNADNHGPDQVRTRDHGQKPSYPWREGNYHGDGFFSSIVITGDKAVATENPDVKMTFKHGDFGEADPQVVEMSGQTNYTVELKTEMMGKEWPTLMVVTDRGKKLLFKSSIKTVPIGYFTWITQEEADLKAISGDPIAAPPSHYKVEPERQGKLVWITGAPGLGKSTTAQMLSRHHSFVFYEGDCFFGLRNPYIPSDVPEASMAQFKQRKLVGEGAKERQELAIRVNNEFMKMFSGEVCNDTVIEEGYKEMCSNIRQERARMGGDWAVCCVLLTRKIRDIVRWNQGLLSLID